MRLNSLIIEITRRCNLKCEHCLRGDAEPIDIKDEYFETFIVANNITEISEVTFTGGEPLARVDKVRSFLDCCKKYEVEIYSFYIATNGCYGGPRVINTLIDLYVYCCDNEITSVQISNSKWHTKPDMDAVKRLRSLKFVSWRDGPETEYLLGEGRARDNFDTKRVVEVDEIIFEDGDIVEGNIYLNALGEIIPGCDFSYARQKEVKRGLVEMPLVGIFKDEFKASEIKNTNKKVYVR